MYCRNCTGTVSCVLCREVVLFGKFKMYCRNCTGTVSCVLCREVVFFGRFKMYCRNCTGTVSCVLCKEVYLILCPYLGESTIGASTVATNSVSRYRGPL